MTSDVNMIYTKVVSLNVIFNFVVDNFFIEIVLRSKFCFKLSDRNSIV